jgi:hypothetical protein
MIQSLRGGRGLQQILTETLQDHLVTEELGGLVVDE